MIVFEILLVLLGAGSGLVLAPTMEIVMAAIPTPRAGVASAYNSAVRSIGGALGIAVLGSVLSTAYRSRIGVSLGQIPASVREAAAEAVVVIALVISAVWLPGRESLSL